MFIVQIKIAIICLCFTKANQVIKILNMVPSNISKELKSKYLEWYRQNIYYFRAETEYEVARSTPLFKKQVVDKLDPNEYPHIHDQMRNHMITSKYLLKLFFKKYNISTEYNNPTEAK